MDIHDRGCPEYWFEERSGPEGGDELLLGEDGSEVMGVEGSIIAISLFGVDVPSSS